MTKKLVIALILTYALFFISLFFIQYYLQIELEGQNQIKPPNINDFLKAIEKSNSQISRIQKNQSEKAFQEFQPQKQSYCERVKQNPPQKFNKFIFTDHTSDLFTQLWSFKGWYVQNPIEYLPAHHSPTGLVEKVPPNTDPDYVMFAPESVNMFIISRYLLEQQRRAKPNVDFACADYQLYNRIPGSYILDQQHQSYKFWTKYVEQTKKNNQEHCIDEFGQMPITLDLDDVNQCKEFFQKLPQIIKEVESQNLNWIIKYTGKLQRTRTIMLNQNEINQLIHTFDYGAQCGNIKSNHIVQQYIKNALTIMNKKFDIRVYLIITSTNPLVAFYHDGFIRFSKENYNPNSTNIFSHVTNKFNEQDENLSKELYISFEDFEKQLVKEGITNNQNLMKKRIIPEIKKKLIHLIRMAYQYFQLGKGYYEIFAMDFLIDQDFNLWFLTADRNPTIIGVQLEVKRDLVLEFTNLIEQRLFGRISTDELPYKSFNPIIDTSKQSKSKYFGLLSDECISLPYQINEKDYQETKQFGYETLEYPKMDLFFKNSRDQNV